MISVTFAWLAHKTGELSRWRCSTWENVWADQKAYEWHYVIIQSEHSGSQIRFFSTCSELRLNQPKMPLGWITFMTQERTKRIYSKALFKALNASSYRQVLWLFTQSAFIFKSQVHWHQFYSTFCYYHQSQFQKVQLFLLICMKTADARALPVREDPI